MKLDKLTKQLRRDLLANPKKAAVLGLMVLVALYFWAPMVWGWIAPGKTAKPVASVEDLILEDEPVAVTSKGTKVTKGLRWERARQQMEGDRQMQSATLGATWRNPFENRIAPVQPPTSDGSVTEVAPVAATEVNPAALGLELRSVLMSPRGRAATISGEVYREGETIVVGDKAEALVLLEFRLVRVGRHAVELERDGKTFVLEMQRAQMAKGDAISHD